jgi:hypothetical protein
MVKDFNRTVHRDKHFGVMLVLATFGQMDESVFHFHILISTTGNEYRNEKKAGLAVPCPERKI